MGYKTICNFGTCMNNDLNQPLSMCLVQGSAKGFARGPGNTNAIGPASKACLEYMSERCANKFDGYCQIYRDITNTDKSYFPNSARDTENHGNGGQPLGNGFMAATLQKALFEFNQPKVQEPFDPLTASSPLITKYSGGRDLSKAFLNRSFDWRGIDQNQLVQIAIQDPVACGRTMYYLYRLADSNQRRIDSRSPDGRADADLRSSHVWYKLVNMFGQPQPGDRALDRATKLSGARKAGQLEAMNINSGGTTKACINNCGIPVTGTCTTDSYGIYTTNASGVTSQQIGNEGCGCPPSSILPVY